ncbi:MAG: hypothetical protein ACKPKO_45385, partial [Candidatus Fonsibacter sp.]
SCTEDGMHWRITSPSIHMQLRSYAPQPQSNRQLQNTVSEYDRQSEQLVKTALAVVSTYFVEGLKKQGVEVEAPLCRVPVIQRLQATRVGGITEPFVLLPAIIFQLKNYVAGTDYGTLTADVNRLMLRLMQRVHKVPTAGSFKRHTWVDVSLQEFRVLKPSLERCQDGEIEGDQEHLHFPLHTQRHSLMQPRVVNRPQPGSELRATSSP